MALSEAEMARMWEHVRRILEGHKAIPLGGSRVDFAFRDRYAHTQRVFHWAQRLLREEKADGEAVRCAVIFHDAGYAFPDPVNTHPIHSARICRAYLDAAGFDPGFTAKVCFLIARHSDKKLPPNVLTLDQQVLMDADALDETGALSILWDCMAEGARPREAQSFEATWHHLQKYTLPLHSQNPMRTRSGQRFWQEKNALVAGFMASLQQDLFEGE